MVLDSSVLIAAMARPGTCTELTDEIARDHTLVLSEFILNEVEAKLQEKFGMSSSHARALVASLRDRGEVVAPTSVPADACRDPDDLPVLGTAVGGQARLLVSLDKDLLALGSFQGIPIAKPGRAFSYLVQG